MTGCQVITLKLGPDDKHSSTSADDTSYAFDILNSDARLTFGLGRAMEDLADLGIVPSETAIDLSLFSVALTAADIRISRDANAQDGWSRELGLDVPVSDPAIWRTVEPLPAKTLNFLTGDRWTLQFRARPSGYSQLSAPTTKLRLRFHRGRYAVGADMQSERTVELVFIDFAAGGGSPIWTAHPLALQPRYGTRIG